MLMTKTPSHQETLPLSPAWMRAALWTTGALNLFGAILFLPVFSVGRAWLSLPTAGHPLYLWIVSEFIFIMGVAYAYCAWTNRAPRVFIAVGAAGKLAFFFTLTAFWLAGDLPVTVPLLGSSDFLLGSLFLAWLSRAEAV